MSEVHTFMFKWFKITFQEFDVWRCSFTHTVTFIGAINSALSSGCFLLIQGMPTVL